MMKCPFCGNIEDKVLDTRPTDESSSIRRRRECLSCSKRFTTYEVVESQPLIVVKKNGTIEAFDKSKIMIGLLRACEKRPVDIKIIEDVPVQVEQKIKALGTKEIKSSLIGTLIMEALKDIDLIAYVRFVSVYKEFNSIDAFMCELNSLIRNE